MIDPTLWVRPSVAEGASRWPRVGAVAGLAVLGVLGALILGWMLDRAFPPGLDRLHNLSPVVTDRDGRVLRAFRNTAGVWRLSPGPVTPLLRTLLIAAEDKRFETHFGVDPLAVMRAAAQNLSAGHIVSGASTITMQVARLLEPRPRTLASKLTESLRALQLERRYDKDAILAMYLTLAPFGGNVEGMAAAARAWFDTTPAGLSVADAALLVALPQSPERLRPDRFPDRARRARAAVLARAVAMGVIDAATADRAAASPVPQHRHDMPLEAPHLARRLARSEIGATVPTTIDRRLQRAVADVLDRARDSLNPRGNAAVLVIDNASRAVLAYAGSIGLLDDHRHGAIDLVRAPRSPGSALKPFLYGLAFDDRLAHPDTLVADVSTRFGGYAPANFEAGFSGDLTVREALQRSRNVPAVMLLDRYGAGRFAAALEQAGTALLFPRDLVRPGLPLILGGVSISLWDLTTLYVGLARRGAVAPLRVQPSDPTGRPVRLLSADAAHQVVAILLGTPPPPGLIQIAGFGRRPTIALKTGTSYGFRDAWAFGITRAYTVGVWTGRPDGTPSPDRYGRNTAAPILVRIFDRLPDAALVPAVAPDNQPNTAPVALRRLRAVDVPDRPSVGNIDRADRLRLVFPTEGIVLEAKQTPEGIGRLALQAAGGRRPLTWLVNGRRINSRETRRDTIWQPDGTGTSRITVIDAAGQSDAAVVHIR